MRTNKGLRRLAAVVIIFAMVLSMGFDAVRVFAETLYEDSVKVFKTAEPGTSEGDDCRTFDVELRITGDPPSKPVDVVLVIDTSTSMKTGKNNFTGRIGAAKTAANKFADIVLDAGNNSNNNRVSIVNYGTRANNQLPWEDDLTTVKSSINSLTIGSSEYTNIQEGFIFAGALIDGARAGATKVIVMMSDGGANRWMDGVNNTILRFSDTYPIVHTDSTKAAYFRGQALQNKANIFTVGLFSGMVNDQYLIAKDTLKQAAPAGNFHESPDPADLEAIYTSIAGLINHSATNAVVTDEIGDDFDLILSSLPASASYDPATRIITWSPGTIGTEASLKYKVKLKDTHPGGNGLETNKSTVLSYTDVNGSVATKDFLEDPRGDIVNVEVSTISLEIKKLVYKSDGIEALPDDVNSFSFNIIGPDSYNKDFSVTQQDSEILENLAPGEYTITETGLNSSGFDIIGENLQVITLGFKCGSPLETITFKNKKDNVEVGNGSIEIIKIIKDTHGEVINEGRSFVIKLTGPSYLNGEEFTISNSQAKLIDNLIPGKYTIIELNSEHLFEITIDKSPLDIASNQTTNVTITNKEKNVGELIVNKILRDKDGIEISADNREFNIVITGPSGYSESISLKSGQSETLKGLEYGEYTASEENAAGHEKVEDYIVSVSGVANLIYSGDGRYGKITITNKEKGEHSKTIDIPVEKKWVGRTGESVQINLVRGEELVGEVLLSEENNWKHVFEGLVEPDDDYVSYYWIDEIDLSDEYTSAVTGDAKVGFIVTNTYNEPYNPSIEYEGNLMITKNVQYSDGSAYDGTEKDFNFEIRNAAGTLVLSSTITTNSTKQSSNIVLSPGTYIVTEVNIPTGFSVNLQEQTVEIVDGGTTNLSFTNTMAKTTPPSDWEGEIEIEKTVLRQNEDSKDLEMLGSVVELLNSLFNGGAKSKPLELNDDTEQSDIDFVKSIISILENEKSKEKANYFIEKAEELLNSKSLLESSSMERFEEDLQGIDKIQEEVLGLENQQEEQVEEQVEEQQEELKEQETMFIQSEALELKDLLENEPTNKLFTFELFRIVDGVEVSMGTVIINGEGTANFDGLPEGSYILRELAVDGYTSSLGSGLPFYLNSDTEKLLNPIKVINTEGGVPQPPTPTPQPEPEPEAPTPRPEIEPNPQVEIEPEPIPQAKPPVFNPLPEFVPQVPVEEEVIEEVLPEAEPEVDAEEDNKPEPEIEILAEPVPQAKPVATLPRTGAASPFMASGFGTLLLAAGLLMRRKKR